MKGKGEEEEETQEDTHLFLVRWVMEKWGEGKERKRGNSEIENLLTCENEF